MGEALLVTLTRYKHIQPAHKSLDDKYYEPLMAMVMKAPSM